MFVLGEKYILDGIFEVVWVMRRPIINDRSNDFSFKKTLKVRVAQESPETRNSQLCRCILDEH